VKTVAGLNPITPVVKVVMWSRGRLTWRS